MQALGPSALAEAPHSPVAAQSRPRSQSQSPRWHPAERLAISRVVSLRGCIGGYEGHATWQAGRVGVDVLSKNGDGDGDAGNCADLGLGLCDVNVVLLIVIMEADAVAAREAGEAAQRHLQHSLGVADI